MSKLVSGVVFIIAGVLLAITPAYTFIKGFVVDNGGSIGLAIAIAWG